jgi:O-antigen ligase
MTNVGFFLALLVIFNIAIFGLLILKIYLRNLQWIIPSILILISFGVLIQNIYLPREVIAADSSIYLERAIYQGNELWVRIGQITTFLFYLLSGLGILAALFLRRESQSKRGLFVTIVGISVYIPVIISSLVSPNGGFRHELFIFPIFILAVYLSPRQDLKDFYKLIQIITLVFIYGSIIALIVNPSWAGDDYFSSWIGLNYRFSGLLSHANGLGYLSVVSIMITVAVKQRKTIRALHIIASLFTLILSQSKTAWLALIIWVIYFLITRYIRGKKTMSSLLMFSILIGIFISIPLIIKYQSFFSFLPEEVTSLTGRTDIWNISIGEWRENPIIGYGPNFWNLDYRLSLGEQFLWAGQAHNQVLHTLGESGLLGIITLLVYLLVIYLANRNGLPKKTMLLSSLTILLFVRLITETPLRNFSLDHSFIIHAIFFILLINTSTSSILTTHLDKTNTIKTHQ